MSKKVSQPEKVIMNTYNYGFKKQVLDAIENGRISINQASKVYGVSRSTIQVWMQKFGNFDKKLKQMGGKSAQQEIKELRARLKEYETKEEIWKVAIEVIEKDFGVSKKKFLPEPFLHFLQDTKKR